jgi:hypothetical protein
LQIFVKGYDASEPVNNVNEEKVVELPDLSAVAAMNSIEHCRQRASLEASLLVSDPEV